MGSLRKEYVIAFIVVIIVSVVIIFSQKMIIDQQGGSGGGRFTERQLERAKANSSAPGDSLLSDDEEATMIKGLTAPNK
jgi:hypothetical protein